MEELLQKFIGARIDVNCGSGVLYSGKAAKVEAAVLTLADDEGGQNFISVDKIISIIESKEVHSKPGFIG